MLIRKAKWEEIPTISWILAQSWKVAYQGMVSQNYLDDLKEDHWVNTFQTWLEEDSFVAQIIFDKETPVGCILYGKGREKGFEDWGEIGAIYLLPDHFRKGLGSILLKKAMEDLRNMGYQKHYLWALEANIKAHSFYKKHGFRKTDTVIRCEIAGESLIDFMYVYP